MINSGTIYKLGNLEAYADKGSIVVKDYRKHITKRISVPEWRSRMADIASYGLSKHGAASGYDRDRYTESVHIVHNMQAVLKEACAQGDVTNPDVLRSLADEILTNKKYTMKPKAAFS